MRSHSSKCDAAANKKVAIDLHIKHYTHQDLIFLPFQIAIAKSLCNRLGYLHSNGGNGVWIRSAATSYNFHRNINVLATAASR
mmetsp:Transcript_6508/g.9515  ORF Transcript_6508/g.9515 Transcript_6508/m.9515 type:complete len:83 (-) Transcript_6508:1165-1413(-)